MQLAAKQQDGSTLRQHLQVAARGGERPDPRLFSQAPRAAAALWEAFLTLHASRPSGMGASGIPSSELLAWQQLHGVRLSPWEVDTLRAMDQAALAVAAENNKGH
jgi:hypothetical protein